MRGRSLLLACSTVILGLASSSCGGGEDGAEAPRRALAGPEGAERDA